MRILIIHNRYQLAGGEDAVVKQEKDLLAQYHEVTLLTFDNENLGPTAALGLFENRRAQQIIKEAIGQIKPDLVHFHNIWYAIGPSVYQLVKRLGIPIVQTLHNFRQVCLNGLLSREGQLCTACLGRSFPLPGILHRCNKGSVATSAVLASSLFWHNRKGSFSLPDVVICLTAFQKQKMMEGNLGYSNHQVIIKPNFTPDPVHDGEAHATSRKPYFLFAGRLSEEKGAQFLPALARLGIKIKVAGTGPLEATIRAQAEPNLELLGWQTEQSIQDLMLEATGLLLPSTWHEGLPVVLVKAFAAGLPIITTDNENLGQLVTHGYNGFCVQQGNVEQLAEACTRLTDPATWQDFNSAARATYQALYTPDRNLNLLEAAYKQAIAQSEVSKTVTLPM